MGNPFIFAVRFLKEVNVEMKKVKWLNKNELIQYTIVVLVISAVVGVYLGALDFVFQEAFEWVLDQFTGSEGSGVETEATEGATTDPAPSDDPTVVGGEEQNQESGSGETEAEQETTDTESTDNN